jgi:hypothetical protein
MTARAARHLRPERDDQEHRQALDPFQDQPEELD